MIKLSKLINDFKEVIQYCRDKYWFYYVIDGNEFHPSLNINMKNVMFADNYKKAMDKEVARITPIRERAHRLDMLFNGE